MDDAVCTIKTSKKEIVLLAAFMKENNIIGVEDPFLGYLAEQIEIEWENVKRSLAEKDYITINDDKIEIIKQELALVVKLCCNPDYFVILNIYDNVNSVYTVTYNFDNSEDKHVLIEDADNDVILHLCNGDNEIIKDSISKMLLLPPKSNKLDCIVEIDLLTIRDLSEINFTKNDNVSKEEKDVLESLIKQPDKKILLTYGKANLLSINAIGIYIKDDKFIKLAEKTNGKLTISTETAEDIFNSIIPCNID